MPAIRRLAAILAADVAGYSRLIGADEAGTAQALREHRIAADPLVAGHGGRIVKTTGDGVLIEGKEGTYDGSHYTRAVNARVLAGLMAKQSDLAVDWRKEDLAAVTALYHRRLAEFIETTTAEAEPSAKK